MTLYKDIMPYFNKYKHVYGWNLRILWSAFKIWTPKHFTMANFRHPISNSWLRPCLTRLTSIELSLFGWGGWGGCRFSVPLAVKVLSGCCCISDFRWAGWLFRVLILLRLALSSSLSPLVGGLLSGSVPSQALIHLLPVISFFILFFCIILY